MAYVFGRREDQAFLELKELLAPSGVRTSTCVGLAVRSVSDTPPRGVSIAPIAYATAAAELSESAMLLSA